MPDISTWVLAASVVVFIYALAKLERAANANYDAQRMYKDALGHYGRILDLYDKKYEERRPLHPKVRELLNEEQTQYEQVEKDHVK